MSETRALRKPLTVCWDGKCSWQNIVDAGLASVLVAQERGGFGGNWDDALVILKACGRHATLLPLAEAILAAHLANEAGITLDVGTATISPRTIGKIAMGAFTGEMQSVPWGSEAEQIIGVIENTIIVMRRADAKEIRRHKNPAGEPRDTLRFESAPTQSASGEGWNADGLFRSCARAAACVPDRGRVGARAQYL